MLVNKFEESITIIEHQVIVDEVYEHLTTLKHEISGENFEALKDSNVIKQFQVIFTNFKDDLIHNGAPLTKFWLSYLQMVEILLNTLYAVRTGSWCLLLECIRDITAYALHMTIITMPGI